MVELILVVAAIIVLWQSFERVAQLGGAGRDQRFLDRGITVAGLPDAIVPAACESVGSLAEARVADALCGSRRKASARPPTHIPSTVAQAIARTGDAFQRPLRDAEQRALALRVQAESGGAELREQADAIAAIESDIAPFRQRFRIASGDDAGPLPLRCAARWVDGALAARLPADAEAANSITARANAVLLLAAALDGRAAIGAAGGRGPAARRAAAHRRMSRRERVARRDRGADGRCAPVGRQRAQERGDARPARRRPAGSGRRRWRSATRCCSGAGARASPGARRRRGARRLGRRRLAGARALAARRRPRASSPAALDAAWNSAPGAVRPRRSPARRRSLAIVAARSPTGARTPTPAARSR